MTGPARSCSWTRLMRRALRRRITMVVSFVRKEPSMDWMNEPDAAKGGSLRRKLEALACIGLVALLALLGKQILPGQPSSTADAALAPVSLPVTVNPQTS